MWVRDSLIVLHAPFSSRKRKAEGENESKAAGWDQGRDQDGPLGTGCPVTGSSPGGLTGVPFFAILSYLSHACVCVRTCVSVCWLLAGWVGACLPPKPIGFPPFFALF